MSSPEVKPTTMHVPFDEADGEGIVFFGNYFRLAHRALEQFLPQIGIPWAEWFKNPDFGVPLRHAAADYLGPIRPGDEISIHVKINEVGESSVQFAYEIRDASGKPTSTLRTSHVFVGRQTRKKMNIPEALRQRLVSH
jgi:1,4-dihydroxy-2-naphthoyl-CoA hydrolase